MLALSDPVEEQFSGKCCHDHNQACPECKSVVDVLKAIEDTLRNGDLDSSEKQKERARWDLDRYVSSIESLESSFIEDFSTISSETRYIRSVRRPDYYGH